MIMKYLINPNLLIIETHTQVEIEKNIDKFNEQYIYIII